MSSRISLLTVGVSLLLLVLVVFWQTGRDPDAATKQVGTAQAPATPQASSGPVQSATQRSATASTDPSAQEKENASSPQSAALRASAKKTAFSPPPRSELPDDEFGALVRKGERVFTDTQNHAGRFVGNELQCANCHLDAGRLANSAPLWAAYGLYPKYRGKNKHVNDYVERIQGCFTYSMNGTPPPRGSDVLLALQAYSFWLAQGAPAGKKLPGQGYPALDEPEKQPDYARGKQVFANNCALCHGDNGEGQRAANGAPAFPPLWGKGSYNWGAGMHRVNTAAGFIKANMPLGAATLSNQQAWDVARFINSHERPQDPRFTGSVEDTAKQFHGRYSMYGKQVQGERLGTHSPPSGAADK